MIERVDTPDAPKALGPYSQAVKAGGFLFISGMLAIDPATGELKGESAAEQTVQIFKNIRAVVKEAGAKNDDEYGFLPYFMSNDENDFANQMIQSSPSKQVMLDGQMASEKEKAEAKEFLNWIVYSEIGQQMLVKTCNVIPPFRNNPYEPEDPLSRDIYEHVQENRAFNASAIVPNDHWSILGGAMQKYLANRCDREELIGLIEDYWTEQK